MAGLDNRSAEAFFSRKVPGAARSEGSKHIAYRIYAPNGRLLLGNLTISRRASGDELDLRNLKGLATDMGLSLDGFVEASRCRIRPEVVVLCIISRVLDDALSMYRLDPVSFDEDLVAALGKAIDEWINIIPNSHQRKLTTKESKELLRCERRLLALSGSPAIDAYITRLAERAGQLIRK
jgi:hypothetical protein